MNLTQFEVRHAREEMAGENLASSFYTHMAQMRASMAGMEDSDMTRVGAKINTSRVGAKINSSRVGVYI